MPGVLIPGQGEGVERRLDGGSGVRQTSIRPSVCLIASPRIAFASISLQRKNVTHCISLHDGCNEIPVLTC
ncbi:hypothetical protein, partial [Streptomyces gardneri]|uniref:hypothetical protein n=1 Tax=Streptomyces gardneri TaxID=66892 RepID=UPI001C3F6B7C